MNVNKFTYLSLNKFPSFDSKKLANLILALFIFFIPIDMLNGVLIRNGMLSISFLYKSTVLFLILLYFNKIHEYVTVFILIFIVMFLSFFYGAVSASPDFLPLMLIKFFSIVFYFLFFLSQIRQQRIQVIMKIVLFSFIFLFLNSLIGALGFGYPMYTASQEVSIGSRGLIFAGNELGVALVVAGAILMMKYITEENYKLFFVIGTLMLFSSAVLVSKVAILGSLFIILTFLTIGLFSRFKGFKINSTDINKLSFVFLCIFSMASFSIYYALYESNLISRLTHNYQSLDLLSFIFSGRNIRVSTAIYEISHNFTLFQILFGTNQHDLSTEIDIFDFMLVNGVVGVFASYGLFVFSIAYVILNRFNCYSFYILHTIFLLFLMSLMAGHVFNSGTAGFLLAALLSLAFFKSRSNVYYTAQKVI